MNGTRRILRVNWDWNTAPQHAAGRKNWKSSTALSLDTERVKIKATRLVFLLSGLLHKKQLNLLIFELFLTGIVIFPFQDGSINIPQALWPYMGGVTKLEPGEVPIEAS